MFAMLGKVQTSLNFAEHSKHSVVTHEVQITRSKLREANYVRSTNYAKQLREANYVRSANNAKQLRAQHK
jgi:hypothetical protein